jgi:hypothetical protein
MGVVCVEHRAFGSQQPWANFRAGLTTRLMATKAHKVSARQFNKTAVATLIA